MAAKRIRVYNSEEVAAADAEAKEANRKVFLETKPDVGTWTGGSVWESGQYLADYLRKLPLDWGSTRVVELGTGTGLVGLTAAVRFPRSPSPHPTAPQPLPARHLTIGGAGAQALGAAHVVLTDQVLHVARYNAERNFEPAELERRGRLHELRWGDEAGITALGDEGFDLIVGSDIIYHAEHHNVLAETMAALAKPGTVVLLCTPDGSPTQGYGSREPNDHPFYNTMCAALAPPPLRPFLPPALPRSEPESRPITAGGRWASSAKTSRGMQGYRGR